MNPEALRRLVSACRYRAAFIGTRRLVAGAVMSLALAAVAWFVLSPTPTPVELVAPRADAVTSVAEQPAMLVVHVAGAVRRPGVYEMPGGSRVIDAVTAAGGALATADLEGINLAVSVADAEQVFIPPRRPSRPRTTVAPRHRPRPGNSSVPPSGDAAPSTGTTPGGARTVDVNSASAAQLESLTGIGPSLAKAIVSYRTQKGPFTKVEDLLNVPGIGAAKLAAMRNEVRVG